MNPKKQHKNLRQNIPLKKKKTFKGTDSNKRQSTKNAHLKRSIVEIHKPNVEQCCSPMGGKRLQRSPSLCPTNWASVSRGTGRRRCPEVLRVCAGLCTFCTGWLLKHSRTRVCWKEDLLTCGLQVGEYPSQKRIHQLSTPLLYRCQAPHLSTCLALLHYLNLLKYGSL